MPGRIPDEELIDDLQHVAERVGRAPTTTEYDKHGQHKPATLRSRWGGWEEVLEAAGLDPEEREADTGGGGGVHVICPNCKTRQRYAGDRDRFQCKECYTKVPLWRGRVLKFRDNELVRQLATGPRTRSEVTRSPQGDIKDLVERLEAPPVRTYHKSREGPRETVLYLYGDERAAIRKFIEVNEDYVADVLSDQRNPLQSRWDQSMYEMLIQQWEWREDR